MTDQVNPRHDWEVVGGYPEPHPFEEQIGKKFVPETILRLIGGVTRAARCRRCLLLCTEDSAYYIGDASIPVEEDTCDFVITETILRS